VKDAVVAFYKVLFQLLPERTALSHK